MQGEVVAGDASTHASPATFEAFVHASHRRLYRLAFGLVGGKQPAEDLVQSALLATFERWRRIRDNPEGYARRSLYHAFLNDRRRLSREERAQSRREPAEAAKDFVPEFVEHASVWQALAQLTQRQRAIVVARYYEGLTEAETAALLGLALGTVKSHHARALTHLRAVMSDDQESEQ